MCAMCVHVYASRLLMYVHIRLGREREDNLSMGYSGCTSVCMCVCVYVCVCVCVCTCICQ